jgi:hypothetical protein
VATNVKAAPISGGGEYDITLESPVSVVLAGRAAMPYPPGNIRVNGHSYGVRPATVTGDLTVTWNSRNKLTQAVIVAQDSGDIPGETGQTFQVQKKIAGIAVGAPINVGAAETFTYAAVQRGTDDPDFTKLTTLEIRSVLGSLTSFFAQVVSTTMFGAATNLPSPGRYEFSAVSVGGLLL